MELNGSTLENAINNVIGDEFNGTIVISHGDEQRVECFGFADREAGESGGLHVQYDIGSLTKQFTSTAVLHLQMRGKLSVSDPLSLYFPAMRNEKAAISLHQLLRHTAGFPHALGDDYTAISRDEFVELAASNPLLFKPDEGFSYSNVGYGLLAAVVEISSGVSYERYLRDELFEPSGMQHTGYVLHERHSSVIASGYREGKLLGKPDDQLWSEDGPYWHLHGNGGLLSSASDLLRWSDVLLGNSVLDSDAKKQMYTSDLPEHQGKSFYGYGWQVNPNRFNTMLVSHAGGNGIFFVNLLRFVEKDLVIFVATNSVQQIDRDTPDRLAMSIFADSENPQLNIRPTHPLIDAVINNNRQQLRAAATSDILNNDVIVSEAFYQSVLLNRIELAEALFTLGVSIESLAVRLIGMGATIESLMIVEVPLFEGVVHAVRKDYFLMLLNKFTQAKNIHKNTSAILPLVITAFHDDTKLASHVGTLLDQGANIHALDEEGDTALIRAGWMTDNLDLICLLIEKGAAVNAQNGNGDTALIDTANLGKIEIMKHLLNSGADPTIQNKTKQSALDIARIRKNQEAIDLLVKYAD